MHNESHKTRKYTNFTVEPVAAATYFGYVKYPSSGCNYQKCKKDNYVLVALHIII